MNPEHLLEQAERLASAGTGRPRQADLRRAVSTAYYALFHLLTRESSRKVASHVGLRLLVARAFNHAEMKRASVAFAKKQLPEDLGSTMPTATISADLQMVANSFVQLQEYRHRADYDTRSDRGFTRQTARAEVRRAREAFDAWERVRNEAAAEVYLLALLLHGRWGR